MAMTADDLLTQVANEVLPPEPEPEKKSFKAPERKVQKGCIQDGQPFRFTTGLCCPSRRIVDYEEIKKNFYAKAYRYRAGRYAVMNQEATKLHKLLTDHKRVNNGEHVEIDEKSIDDPVFLAVPTVQKDIDVDAVLQFFIDEAHNELLYLHHVRDKYANGDLGVRFRDRWNGFMNFEWCLAFGCFKFCAPGLDEGNLKTQMTLKIQQDILTRYYSELTLEKEAGGLKEKPKTISWTTYKGKIPSSNSTKVLNFHFDEYAPEDVRESIFEMRKSGTIDDKDIAKAEQVYAELLTAEYCQKMNFEYDWSYAFEFNWQQFSHPKSHKEAQQIALSLTPIGCCGFVHDTSTDSYTFLRYSTMAHYFNFESATHDSNLKLMRGKRNDHMRMKYQNHEMNDITNKMENLLVEAVSNSAKAGIGALKTGKKVAGHASKKLKSVVSGSAKQSTSTEEAVERESTADYITTHEIHEDVLVENANCDFYFLRFYPFLASLEGFRGGESAQEDSDLEAVPPHHRHTHSSNHEKHKRPGLLMHDVLMSRGYRNEQEALLFAQLYSFSDPTSRYAEYGFGLPMYFQFMQWMILLMIVEEKCRNRPKNIKIVSRADK